MTGAELIAQERATHEARGWTAEHDDAHRSNEIVRAAMTYTRHAIEQVRGIPSGIGHFPGGWPWSYVWWKPSTDPIRNLVKAGALIAAEIDRLQREAANAEDHG